MSNRHTSMRVAYLGPGGTYSQEAAIQRLGVLHQPYFCNSLAEVVNAVNSGIVDYSILPVENSTNGVVQPAVEALIETAKEGHIKIIDYVSVRVRHQLYTRMKKLEDIKTVYSHPQVWGQTKIWMAENLPNAAKINSSSSAQGVQLALNNDTDGIAALGGPLTSDESPMVSDCADDSENTTRFLVIIRKGTLASLDCRNTDQVVSAVIYCTPINEVLKKLSNVSGTVKFMAASPGKKGWLYSYYLEIYAGVCKELEKEGFTIIGHTDGKVSDTP
ncbi:prephenate dehydratase [Starmerella bacillaris]|uniref:Prephenate dehydratase n=1 Tax=Starmerella bacillaris TaxID=1247836 RepID=A0AAV5RMC7_STABA|nr:prephenate dehydratase [Starmerella bacillaris]